MCAFPQCHNSTNYIQAAAAMDFRLPQVKLKLRRLGEEFISSESYL